VLQIARKSQFHNRLGRTVYSVQVGNVTYEIARRRDKVEMVVGQELKCRVEHGHFFVFNEKGKETKYDIVGTESKP
jgi:hypothetical protein